MKKSIKIVSVNRHIFYVIITLLSLIIKSGQADFITLIQADKCETIIEIRIQEEVVQIAFEIGEKDALWFKNIIPTKYYPGGFTEYEKINRFKTFFAKDFILTADGRQLNGNVILTEIRERIPRTSLYTGKVDTTSTASKYVVYVEVHYPLKNKPKQISFTPPIENDKVVTMANIGFVTYHKQIPVNDIRYLGVRETIILNWNDPWYSYFENKNIRRHHNSSLMSFLYVDPYEVRHEILARVKDLESWIGFDYKIDDNIEIEEQEILKNQIADFLIKRNIVNIDGNEPTPILDKVHFVEVNMYGIQILEEAKRMPFASAIIGVIFAYSHPGLPQQIKINWDMFNEKITSVPNTATDPAGPMKYIMMPNDNILIWQNFLKKYKLPTISEVRLSSATLNLPLFTLLILIPMAAFIYKKRKKIKTFGSKQWIWFSGAIVIAIFTFPLQLTLEIPFIQKESFSKPEAENLFTEMLKNTYRAFDFREESDIYDKLAVSSSGDLLADVYLQTRKSMVIENQGGIRAKVKDVEVLDVEEGEGISGNLAYNCKWQVSGTVGHWGHIHRRTNQYQAVINIRPVDGVWKMVDLDMVEETRL
jgi:hypothetical protein